MELVPFAVLGAVIVLVVGWLVRDKSAPTDYRPRKDVRPTAPTYSEAIADLHKRVSALEESDAEQRLMVLDAAEKVANKLTDRVRKRRKAETAGYDQDDPEDRDDDERDPDVLLARARAAYPLPSLNQLHLPIGGSQ